jgi:hypothetical protein
VCQRSSSLISAFSAARKRFQRCNGLPHWLELVSDDIDSQVPLERWDSTHRSKSNRRCRRHLSKGIVIRDYRDVDNSSLRHGRIQTHVPLPLQKNLLCLLTRNSSSQIWSEHKWRNWASSTLFFGRPILTGRHGDLVFAFYDDIQLNGSVTVAHELPCGMEGEVECLDLNHCAGEAVLCYPGEGEEREHAR